jgi:hypothetical protein
MAWRMRLYRKRRSKGSQVSVRKMTEEVTLALYYAQYCYWGLSKRIIEKYWTGRFYASYSIFKRWLATFGLMSTQSKHNSSVTHTREHSRSKIPPSHNFISWCTHTKPDYDDLGCFAEGYPTPWCMFFRHLSEFYIGHHLCKVFVRGK